MDQPVACSLTAAAYAERLCELRALGRSALLARDRIAGGERLVFRDAPDVERALRAAIEAEAECCPFLTMTLERRGGRLVLEVSGPEEAQPVIAALWA